MPCEKEPAVFSDLRSPHQVTKTSLRTTIRNRSRISCTCCINRAFSHRFSYSSQLLFTVVNPGMFFTASHSNSSEIAKVCWQGFLAGYPNSHLQKFRSVVKSAHCFNPNVTKCLPVTPPTTSLYYFIRIFCLVTPARK